MSRVIISLDLSKYSFDELVFFLGQGVISEEEFNEEIANRAELGLE